ncbi:MAG TPA: hypothetical protein VFE05_14645 [Longimicrobiaceae bacterium]|nr:hypothetical protein [Longimicrobiaceae bacterium]
MIRRDAMFAAWCVAVAVVVVLAGRVMAAPSGFGGVMAGAALGCVFQVVAFAVLTALFPGKGLLVYGVGMMGRLALVVLTALLVLPAAGLPAAPTLFSMVTVLFVTTLLEPVLLAADHKKKL